MSNLGEIKTIDLLNELVSRSGVEKIIGSGLYAPYELKRKYSNDRAEINPDIILVIENLDHLDA